MSADLFASPAAVADPAKSIRACPFDLVARAELAIRACTLLVNPERDGQPYSFAELHTEPPIALHSPWDYADVAGRLLDSLTLARMMTGQHPDETDASFARILSKCQREDGLIALPPDAWTHTAPIVELEWSQRGALMAWTTRTLAIDEADAPARAARLVHALSVRAVWEGETCWYPASYLPDKGWASRLPPPAQRGELLIGAQIVFPLARFAAATGNGESLRLANGLIRFLRERSGAFEEDGRIRPSMTGYVHSTTGFILGVLKYGLVADRADYVEWAHNAYRSACDLGTEFGFFPHGLRGQERSQGDVCALQDMIEIALLLGLNRDTACLADAERFGRNHLLETQILDYDWVQRSPDVAFCQDIWCSHHPPEGFTTDDVCGRSLGAYSGWHTLNDAIDPANPRLMQRCTGAGTRALYDLWRHSVTRPEGAVMVNLHFSRDTRWATVTSYLPQEGRLDIMMKTRGVLAVRLPTGVTNPDVMVNHARARQETVRNGYAWIEALQPGDLVSVTWPNEERVMLYDIEGKSYTAHWRGDTLMRMAPPGQLNPLYWRTPELMPPAKPRGLAPHAREIDSI
jgi:hypothetical protein